jgi:hypothetical protein
VLPSSLKAAALRDTEKQLLARKTAREREWKDGDMDVVAEVNEERVAETFPIMTGLSSDGTPSQRRSDMHSPPLLAASMTADDLEIWAMS